MKNLFTSLAVLGVMLSVAYPAHAVCDQSGLHVVSSSGNSGDVQTFDLAPAGIVTPFVYQFHTTNTQIIDNLNSAWVGHLTVRIIGDAAVCPAAGTVRFAGNILTLFRQSF